MRDCEESISKPQMEEINLGQIFNLVWNAKWFMLGGVAVFIILVYLLVIVKPIKPDTYSVTQMVEIATLQIKSPNRTSGPFSLERSRDVVKILPSLTNSSIQFTVPNAADKVILLSESSTDKELALSQIAEAVSILEKRHNQMIKSLNDVEIITVTSALNKPKVVFIPFESKFKKYALFAIVFGGLFGLLSYLLFQTMKKGKT